MVVWPLHITNRLSGTFAVTPCLLYWYLQPFYGVFVTYSISRIDRVAELLLNFFLWVDHTYASTYHFQEEKYMRIILPSSHLLILPSFLFSAYLPSFFSLFIPLFLLLSFLTSCFLYFLLVYLPATLSFAISLNDNAHTFMNLLYPQFASPQFTINIILLIVL